MAPSDHRIGSLEVSLRLRQREQAQPLLDRVSHLRAPRLESMLERVFAELSPPGHHHRLDTVRIDLGRLPQKDFERAFLERLEEALRQDLERRLRALPAEPPEGRSLELLRVFARTGALPWWAEPGARDRVGREIRAVLTLAPQAWWSLVVDLAANPVALGRLAAACDAPTLTALLAERNAMEGSVWRRARSASPERSPDQPSLAEPLIAPPPQDGQQVEEPPLDGQTREDRIPADPEQALQALCQGQGGGEAVRWLLQAGARGLTGSALAEGLLQRLTPSAPGPPPRTAQSGLDSRQAGEAPEPLPDTPDTATTPPGQSVDAPPQSPAPVAANLAPPTAYSAPVAISPAIPRDKPASPSPASLTAPPTARERVGPPWPTRNKQQADPADPEALDVNDGGLVILWPFLRVLFQRLELLEPKGQAFRDDAACCQAIALLSDLVEPDPEPPEWRLPLPKVLGGRSPLAPWLLEEPLPAEWRAEGERLLAAVIGHGGLAAEMGPEELR
ncbi:MAG: hypothetical protein RLZZ117_471, partial [Cyanobacteriota bacterium]